jgi:uncharacterized membrane protein
VNKSLFARWRANFITGLVVVLPGVISVAALLWIFRTASNITDALLIFLPHDLTHENAGAGPMHWYWSTVAFLVAIALISAIGVLARYYIGKQVIEWMDNAMMHVPLLNKFYGAIRQVNEAFKTGKKGSFKTVVLVEFPREGIYSIGFITSEQHNEVQQKMKEKVVCVFVPTTPNPTSGFLILVPEEKVTKLDMSVAEGIKYIVSLGSIFPEHGTPPKIQ